MKLICFVIGLVRCFGRFSDDKCHPLISMIFPIPFKINETDMTELCDSTSVRFVKYFIAFEYFIEWKSEFNAKFNFYLICFYLIYF